MVGGNIGHRPVLCELTCIRCGVTAEEEHFRKNPGGRKLCIRSFHNVCIGCEQEARDARKKKNPWIAKAQSTIAHHAKKYKMRIPTFRERYGWTIERVAHDLQHAYDNTCPYCWRPYQEMKHGLADVTLDVLYPDKPPQYRTNIRACCRTCNTEKSTMDPEKWERRLRFWRVRKAHIDRLKDDAIYGLPLFEVARGGSVRLAGFHPIERQ
jgi:hypothetical protein